MADQPKSDIDGTKIVIDCSGILLGRGLAR